ncbi:MAG: DUF6702 family protein [Bacteroidota bacterium]
MKTKTNNTIWLLLVFLISSSFTHPLKLTTSLIEYHLKKSSLYLECRVFIDDFENSIDRKGMTALSLTKEDKDEIEYYFNEFYDIELSGRKLYLNYKSSEIYSSNNILVLKFSITNLMISKGDQLFIENRLFFADFGRQQSNQMTIRIPPFMSEDTQITTLYKPSVFYKF